MFSPRSAGGPATATRSRRRQRPHSSDTLAQQQPKAKRQRLPVTDNTFAPPSTTAQQNQDEPELLDEKNDRPSRLDARPDEVEHHDAPAPRRELATRIKKTKHANRAGSGDSSVVLTSNSAFIISKLPAFPDRIRTSFRLDGEQRRSSISDVGAQHGEIDSSLGYGLSLSHTHAIIWPYDSTSASPETFVFALPYPSKNHSTDPLPVGCLVLPSAASTEPGLVVIMPLSGKITYWESISAAATLDFMKQDRRGVESSIYGMFSGEKLTQITNAESAGFILSFSSGRMAYMCLRDGHGRPSITTQFLRMGATGSVGGLFGHLRYALSHAPVKGDLAAVRAARSSRIGERDVVALTIKARIHAWRLHRGGHYETLVEVDLRSDILAAIQQVDHKTSTCTEDSLEAIDFTVVPRGLDAKYLDMTRLSDAIALDNDSITHLFVLVGLVRERSTRYAMVEVVMSKGAAQIGLVRPILSYSVPFNQAASALRPRIYLPRPALVALAVFERAVVVASVAAPPQSPHSQLLEDNHMLPSTYEDVIDLREDDASQIIGTGFEEPPPHFASDDARNQRPRTSKNPSVLLMVRGTGVLRVAITDVDKFAGEEAPKVTAKSKLEQAIFFGVKPDNPLVFDRKQQIEFLEWDYESAATQIGEDLLTSSSPHVASIQWKSMEDNLSSRSEALEKLMSHLGFLGVRLKRRSRWDLMFAAEKLAMARLLWTRHQGFIEERPSEDKTTIIGHVVEYINEGQKAIPNVARGEVDSVRHWFLHDVDKLALLVAWLYEAIKHTGRDPRYDPARLTVLIQEAVQLTVCAVLGSHEFRKKNAAMFGLANEDMDMESGILRTGYEDTPAPWTSSLLITSRLKKLVELCLKWLAQHPMAKSDSTRPDPKLLESIRQEVPLLTDLYLLSLCEASRWFGQFPDGAELRMAQEYNKDYEAERYNKPLHVARLEMWAEATVIADKHRSWRSLAMILVDHIHALRRLATEPTTSTSEADRLTTDAVAEEKRVERMLDRHGQPFAFSLYEVLLDRDGVNGVLDFTGDRHGFKTKFLRTKPELAKISWIHDVDREKDIDHAAETLLQLGLDKEIQVWNKKIELSLGKLALLAEKEKPTSKTGMFNLEPAGNTDKKLAQVEQIDRELGVIKIQDQLFVKVYLTVSDAIDEAAEVGLAMDVHGANLPRKHKIVRDVFEDSITRLVKHEVLEPMTLIDLLTLISFKQGQVTDMQDQFYLALVVAKHGLRSTELELATRLIWRRCFIRDDWARINDTSLKGDREVADRLSETALFSTCLACYEKEVPAEPFKFFTPSEALGAFTDTPDRRFAESDKAVCDKITAAMRAEDTLLHKFIDENRLEEWAQTTCNEARRFWTEYDDETTRNGVAPQLSVGGKKTRYDAMEISEDEDAVDMIKSNGLVTPPPGNDDVKARPQRV